MSVSGSGPSKIVQKINEALGVRLFPRPPEGFDPVQASDRELLEYGYPHRPDIDLHPELHERWSRMMSRPMLLIEPQLAIAPDKRPTQQRDQVARTGQSWSGSVVYPPDADQVIFVSGQWTVPAVVAPASYSGSCYCATWLGIDGGPQGGEGGGPDDVLQAGTDQVHDGSGTHTYPWFEWYPAPKVTISNFAVRPGDVVFCAILVHSPTEAGIFMWNVTTRIATSLIKTAPGEDERVLGNTVEWILETPADSNGNPLVLAQFGDVYFDQCLAVTRHHVVLNSGEHGLLSQSDVNGQIIAASAALNEDVFVVSYMAEP